LENIANSSGERGERHFQGVAYLNLSYTRMAMDKPSEALASAEQSISLLGATSAGIELVSARLAKANALALLGDIRGARDEIALVVDSSGTGQALEVAAEVGQLEALFGESAFGWPYLDRVARDVSG